MFDGIGEMVATMIIVIAIISAFIGGLLVWLLPILWTWVKPIIHQLTA